MLVGSITETVKQGDFVRRGDEVGYFGALLWLAMSLAADEGEAYGGSTIIVLFPPGRVQWDADLVANSEVPLETAVRVRCEGERRARSLTIWWRAGWGEDWRLRLRNTVCLFSSLVRSLA